MLCVVGRAQSNERPPLMCYNEETGLVVEWDTLVLVDKPFELASWSTTKNVMSNKAFKLYVRLTSGESMSIAEFRARYPRNKFRDHLAAMFETL